MEEISRNNNSLLNCALCKQECRNPKVLPCLHSCCTDCISSVSSFLQSVRCRICLEDVDSSAFSTLPRNGWYKEVQMNALDLKSQDGFDFCNTYSIAAPHENSEPIPKVSIAHSYHDVDGRQDGNDGNRESSASITKCYQHSMEELRYFCYSCEESICSECLIETHRKHELGKVEECCDKYRAKLALMDVKAQEKAESVNEALNRILFLQQSLSHNTDSAKNIVQNKIRELRAKLDIAEVELMLSIDKEASRKAFLLKRQEEELKLIIEKFFTASSFVNNTVSFANDVEVTLMRKLIEERMKVLDDTEIQTTPECDDKITHKDLELKLNLALVD